MAGLLKAHTADFIARYRPHIACQVESTLARIGFCRTAPLGGRTYKCPQCQSKVSVYNSCGDRHCPRCGGARRRTWLNKASELLLPGVTYFQVVFTLPDKLSSLILGNRRELYRVLMHAAWEALRESIEAELGMRAAALFVLHTWNQKLEHHPHVHALVPGCGPSLDGSRWIECKRTPATRDKPARPFLVDHERLGQKFRERFLAKLERLRRRGKLELAGTCAGPRQASDWTEFTASLTEHDWCVFIERPPTPESTPEHVLKYLARYMTGGPISDRRLVSSQHNRVTFLARNPNKASPQRQIPVRLSGVEFTRRWSLHILPKGFTKTRCYGGYSSTKRTAFVALCQQLGRPCSADLTPDATPTGAQTGEPTELDQDHLHQTDPPHQVPNCATCQCPMQLGSQTFRPSWRDVFHGPDHPPWFES